MLVRAYHMLFSWWLLWLFILWMLAFNVICWCLLKLFYLYFFMVMLTSAYADYYADAEFCFWFLCWCLLVILVSTLNCIDMFDCFSSVDAYLFSLVLIDFPELILLLVFLCWCLIVFLALMLVFLSAARMFSLSCLSCVLMLACFSCVDAFLFS